MRRCHKHHECKKHCFFGTLLRMIVLAVAAFGGYKLFEIVKEKL